MRIKSLLAAGALVAGLLAMPVTASAAPAGGEAAAAGTCSMVMPARFSIRAAVTNFKITLAGNCATARMAGADWTGTTAGSTWSEYLFFYDTKYTDTITMYALSTPIGRTTWIGTGAYDQDYNDIAQTNASSYTKYGSSATLIGGRKGSRTAFIATVGYYNPKVNAFVRWPGKQVLLQYKEVGSSTWKGLKYLTTNASGQASYTYYPNKTRNYRLYVPQNASLWDFYTPAISR
ncbi:hypothetical protein [Kribbella shirazensis]|uniref:DUF1036 domain-containing protein n=1 Tax=Kribbella shirazensis TaxID=1105143 RepID=A0A7X5VIA1_9ACTN|nr:hypothetical protein [Kribbella shirazensis]NIK61276.1 hypothetical protein [Kribbella shirazensis]